MSYAILVKPEKDSCLLVGVPPNLLLHLRNLLLQSSSTSLPAAAFSSVVNMLLGFRFLILFLSSFTQAHLSSNILPAF